MRFTGKQLSDGLKHSVYVRVLVMGFAFLTHILLARVLAQETLGVFYLLMSVLAVFQVVGLHGWQGFLVREIPRARAEKDEGRILLLLRQALCSVSKVLAVVLLLFVFLGPPFFLHTFGIDLSRMTIGLSCVLVMLLVGQRLESEVFRGFHRIGSALIVGNPSAAGAVGYGLLSCVLFVLILLIIAGGNHTVSLELLLSGLLLGSMVSVMFGAVKIKSLLRPFKKLVVAKGIGSQALRLGTLPFGVIALLKVSSSHLENWLVGSMLSVEVVAVVGLATRCAMLLYMPMVLMQSTALSFLAEINAREEVHRYKAQLQTVSFYCLIFFITMVVLVPLVPSAMYTWVFGAGYTDVAHVTYLRIVQFAALGLAGLSFPLIMMSRHVAVGSALLGAQVLVKFIGEYAAVTHFGLNGLLYTGVLVDGSFALIYIFAVRRVLGVWLIPKFHQGAFRSGERSKEEN